MKRILGTLALGWTMALSVTGEARAGLTLGDILVADIQNLAIYDVNPTTGARTIFSEAGVSGSGVAFSSPQGIAIDPLGFVVVADSGLNALISVNEATGNRTIISQGGVQGTGLGFGNPLGITTDSAGNIYVADQGGASGSGVIIEVNPMTGNRTVISGNGMGSGTFFDNIGGISFVGGKLLVTDQGDFATPSSVISVDPMTGARTVLTSGGSLDNVRGITGGTGGLVYTANAGGFLSATSPGSVVSIGTSNGAQLRTSTTGVGSGPSCTDPYGIAIGMSGQLFVTDAGDGTVGAPSELYSVNPTTGARVILSGGSTGSGPSFGQLGLGIAVDLPAAASVVPEPATWILLGQAIVAGLFLHTRQGKGSKPDSRMGEDHGH